MKNLFFFATPFFLFFFFSCKTLVPPTLASPLAVIKPPCNPVEAEDGWTQTTPKNLPKVPQFFRFGTNDTLRVACATKIFRVDPFTPGEAVVSGEFLKVKFGLDDDFLVFGPDSLSCFFLLYANIGSLGQKVTYNGETCLVLNGGGTIFQKAYFDEVIEPGRPFLEKKN